jgi:hypothetical protein
VNSREQTLLDPSMHKLMEYVLGAVLSEGGDGDCLIRSKFNAAKDMAELFLSTCKATFPSYHKNLTVEEYDDGATVVVGHGEEYWEFTNVYIRSHLHFITISIGEEF